MNKKLTALLRFDCNGQLETICLSAGTEEDEKILKKALAKLFLPGVWSWVLTRLFAAKKARDADYTIK